MRIHLEQSSYCSYHVSKCVHVRDELEMLGWMAVARLFRRQSDFHYVEDP